MSDLLAYNTLVVLLGVSALGACAGVVGCFALLKRRALVGDALGHASFPGVCLAYLLVGKSFLVLLLGAGLSAVAGVATLALLRRWTRIKEDAAIGIVLSVFFGAGVALYGGIQGGRGGGSAGLSDYIFGMTAGIALADVQKIAALALATLAAVALCYKELKLVAFDPEFAHVQGWPARALDFVTMLLLVAVVVIGLPAVGALLVAALLIIPAAAARFWTDRLSVMLLLAALLGVAAGVAGTALSTTSSVPAGPSVVAIAAGLFLLSLLFAPRRGVLARWAQARRDRRELLARLRAAKGAAP